MAGVPLVDFSPLGELYNTYQQSKQKAEQQSTLSDLGNAFMSGNVDFNRAGGQLIRAGQLESGLALIKLGEEQKAGQEFSRTLGTLGQPGASPPPSSPGASSPVLPQGGNVQPGSVQPPQTAPRAAPVQPTARVWGDQEAENAGLYEPATRPAARTASTSPTVLGATGAARPDAGGVYDSDAVMLPPEAVPFPRPRPTSFPQAQAQQAQPQEPPAATIAERTAPLGVSPSAGPPPRGAGTVNPASGNVGILAIAAGNPRLPAPQRELAKALLTKALDDTKLTDHEKHYWRTYVPQEVAAGRQPKSFEDFEVNLKRAGAITSGETKFEQDMAGINAKRWGKYLDQAETAQTKLVDINQMREISQRIAAGGSSPGAWAGVKDLLGPYAEAAGVDIKDLSDIQAYTAIIQRLAPQNRAAGSGSTSDIEFKGMLKSMPALIQNPAAREVTLNTMEALARHDLAQGAIASRLAAKEITQVQAEKELRALPDPMTGFRQWRQENQKLYGQALSAKPETQTQRPTQSAIPQELQGKSPTEVMQAAPDGTIFNIQGKRYIKENGKVKPHG